MPRYDGTGPRGEGPFTGRGEGYCALRLPEPGSGDPATGLAGLQGTPVRSVDGLTPPGPTIKPFPGPHGLARARLGRGRRWGHRRCWCVGRVRW